MCLYVLISATKSDLRSHFENAITTKEGETLHEKIKANGYVECSSKFMWNINRVFEAALLSVTGFPKLKPKPRQLCSLL